MKAIRNVVYFSQLDNLSIILFTATLKEARCVSDEELLEVVEFHYKKIHYGKYVKARHVGRSISVLVGNCELTANYLTAVNWSFISNYHI